MDNVYETNDAVFSLSNLPKISIDQALWDSRIEPDGTAIGVVQGLLPSFIGSLDVGPIRLTQVHMDRLCAKNRSLNDPIINAYLYIIASTPASNRIFAVSSYFVSKILNKTIDNIKCIWLFYGIILWSINGDNHWYIIILDIK